MMPFIDLPPQLHERVVCSITASVKYNVPANIVLAVAEKENGKSGQWVKNSNGSDDVGTMQFNTNYLYDLRKYGITPEDVAQKGCYPFDLAAWRLSKHLRFDKGDIWTRAADYHSYTPAYNAVYRADLIKKSAKWENWIEARFLTYNVNFQNSQTLQIQSPQKIMSLESKFSIEEVSLKKPIKTQHYNKEAECALAAEFAPETLKHSCQET
jgi:hypothetical protein